MTGLDIKGKKDITAPTPQNTPAVNAPIQGGSFKPSLAGLGEDDEAATRASILSNPNVLRMLQGGLNSLIGQSSGYIESLPVPVKRRVNGLKAIQAEQNKLEAQLQAEIHALEKKYLSLYQPLFKKRNDIISGAIEPTSAEIEAGEKEEPEFDTEASIEEEPEEGAKIPADAKGVPEFWLTTLKNHPGIVELIEEHDEEALKHLVDLRLAYTEDKPGFKLEFEFSPNDYFTNKVLTKTYYYQEEVGYGGNFAYDHAEGDKIAWKEGKDLTVRTETKKQRNKNTNQTRVVKRSVPTQSFFHFFSPPVPPGMKGDKKASGSGAVVSDDDEDEDDEYDEMDEELHGALAEDYQMGEDLKEKIVPHAVDWFTGKALQYEEIMDDDYDEEDEEEFEEDDEDEDDDEDDDDEDDEDDDEEEGDGKGKKEECKNQ